MFTLIETGEEAVSAATTFLDNYEFYVPKPIESYLPFAAVCPCLISFFEGYQSVNGEIEPMLGFHICTKDIAKCLVYDKTNKLTARNSSNLNWTHISPGHLEDFLEVRSTLYGSNPPFVENDEFSYTLGNCAGNLEPFLYHLKQSVSTTGHRVYHQAIVSLEAAKSLVYYQKNRNFINRFSTNQLIRLIERIEGNDSWTRKDVKAIDYVSRILKLSKKDEEIPF